jgi:hypothetical protein
MVMRYHWAHGVGHTYSHQSQKTRETDNAGLEGGTRETEVRQENLSQTNRSGPQAEGNVTSHPNEEKNEANGDEEASDNDDESDTESYDDYDSEDDNYNYCDADDVSGESDEISDDDIE